jgi:hypothetical protein
MSLRAVTEIQSCSSYIVGKSVAPSLDFSENQTESVNVSSTRPARSPAGTVCPRVIFPLMFRRQILEGRRYDREQSKASLQVSNLSRKHQRRIGQSFILVVEISSVN